MKKLLVLVLAIVMVSGCAGFGKWSSGAQSVVDFVCDPSDAQKAEAAKWLAALDNIQSGVSAFFPAASIMRASSVMTVLKNGGCFVLAEVEAALSLLSDMQTKQVAMMGLKTAPRSASEQFPALWSAVKKGK
jgi:hypothetical protein